MSLYDLSKEQRHQFILDLEVTIRKSVITHDLNTIFTYASDKDTYIRKQVYVFLGSLFYEDSNNQADILSIAGEMITQSNPKIRQTAVYLLGEINDFDQIKTMLELGLKDEHHSVRNGVIGTLKKLGQKNPVETLAFARLYLHNPDPEIRRQIIHGIELHGRTHPQDILPLLRDLQNEASPRVRSMIVHVLGQISYKKGCLEKVLNELYHWNNLPLVRKAIQTILDVHSKQTYCALNLKEAAQLIESRMGK